MSLEGFIHTFYLSAVCSEAMRFQRQIEENERQNRTCKVALRNFQFWLSTKEKRQAKHRNALHDGNRNRTTKSPRKIANVNAS
jgi:hypothetical protein